jgi:transcriptional regulator with XRE-family HTH domain
MGRKPTARRSPYGAWLHYLRKEAKLTQDDASRVTGIPRTTLTTWERTGEMPGREEIFRLAKAYGVSIPRLLRIEKLTQREARLRKKTG